MERHLLGRRIEGVWTSRKRLREPLPARRLKTLVGERFTQARRRAKYLLLSVDSGRTVLVHLGMTGNLLFREDRQKHDHIAFDLDFGPPLVFADARRFGIVLVLTDTELVTCPYCSIWESSRCPVTSTPTTSTPTAGVARSRSKTCCSTDVSSAASAISTPPKPSSAPASAHRRELAA